MKRIWWTNSSIPSERDSPAFCSCWAHFGKEGVPEAVIPKISQEDPRRDDRHNSVPGQFFHESVQKIRLVNYGGDGLQVHSSLLSVVLHD